ncbi:MAG: CsbD family protein [Candidatus Sulfotelmatobacter sp.]
MNKDRVEGKAKDIAGRVERQAGEWTNDPNMQVKGTAKQAEGKVQNAWGKAKDAGKNAADDANASSRPPQRVPDDTDVEEADAKDARRRG